MTDILAKYGVAESSLTITLNSLANGAARESTAVSNTTTLFFTAKIRVKVVTNASNPTGDKKVDVYAYGSAGTNYPDNVTGSDAAITLVNPTNLVFLGSVNCPLASTEYAKIFDLSTVWPGGLPAGWGIVVYNDTGNALGSANSVAKFQGLYAQIV
jgi:hypothetical protein